MVLDSQSVARGLGDPTFSMAVIAWQEQYGRHTLPWQNTRDGYRVWLSEIMLQQTQVTAVIPYYHRFVARFPDVHSLARASIEAVMAHWSGLGYYARARNLHRCAQQVVADYAGVFPCDPVLLQALPGIGRSTAAAIAAFTYGVRAAILDGNVKRVFARVFGIDGYPGDKSIEQSMWERAVALLPEQAVETYTQGLMDLGATVCTRSKPACQHCPLAQRCVALASQRVEQLPWRKPKKTLPEKEIAMLVILNQHQVLLEQRPHSGIWGGLLSLPEIALGPDWEATIMHAMRDLGKVAAYQPLARLIHVFTHFRLQISPFQVVLASRKSRMPANHIWYRLDQLDQAPLPAPVKKILFQVRGVSVSESQSR